MPRSSVTIRDVAAHAGVSHQTVSRVINGSTRVRPETQARVEAAIDELGYRPNEIARFMARGRTATLACISPNLTDYTFASIIDGAATQMRQQGYFLVAASAPDEATFSALIDQLIVGRRVEGLMVINPFADGRHRLLPHDVPAVFAGARPRDEAVDSVALEDERAAALATDHLLELGHQTIAMVTGPMAEDCSQDRCLGYERSLQAAQRQIEPELVVAGDWSAQSGYEAFKEIASKDHPVTAVFAQNDQMAVGVMRAAAELGMNVPDQLSVIGVDDIPLASFFAPSLTTVRQDFARIGREAARLLVRAVEAPITGYEHLRLPAELIIRRSTREPEEQDYRATRPAARSFLEKEVNSP